MEVRWQTEDGYCGGSRPQYITIASSEIESHMSDDDLERFLEDIVQDDFEQRVSFCIRNREQVLMWMRECRDAIKSEEDSQ